MSFLCWNGCEEWSERDEGERKTGLTGLLLGHLF